MFPVTITLFGIGVRMTISTQTVKTVYKQIFIRPFTLFFNECNVQFRVVFCLFMLILVILMYLKRVRFLHVTERNAGIISLKISERANK